MRRDSDMVVALLARLFADRINVVKDQSRNEVSQGADTRRVGEGIS